VANEIAARTRREEPRTWISALNLAYMRYREHDLAGALETAKQGNVDYPGTWPLINLEAELLSKTEGPTAALPIVEQFARDHWWHFPATLALARLHLQSGDLTRAEELARSASRLDVHDAEALNLMTLVSIQRNRLDDAYRTQRRAVSRQPDQARQYVLLSDLLQRMGRPEEARLALAQVARLEDVARGSTIPR
jgi:tetratricopeptide (TPR) repeat protein